MRKDNVSLIQDLHVVQDAKCFSSSSSHKFQPKGRMNSEERLNPKRGLVETDSKFIITLTCFDRAQNGSFLCLRS